VLFLMMMDFYLLLIIVIIELLDKISMVLDVYLLVQKAVEQQIIIYFIHIQWHLIIMEIFMFRIKIIIEFNYFYIKQILVVCFTFIFK
jgi:hypothetical protein